ncbi:endonuclease/exonuclease/phosphatase family protein [Arthrobacter sp. CAN_A1]|uniref:endonuclease/exonuclease/phosphatase family protein n=1 Tax=Arthrobacter sp. CAN_A1 TaxID=2787717 RepID=UPI001A351AEE
MPTKDSSNLLIATWNLRAFGDLTEKWASGPADSPKRDFHALACIAGIGSRFDVLALQEVRRNTTALHHLMGLLGPGWRFITSDVTEGPAGNGERLTYLFDTNRVQPSGLVGEIVLPPGTDGPVAQFVRTPYAAGFTRETAGFVLTTVHVLWGNKTTDRLPEITAFAQWMRGWANRPDDFNENLLVLGDFNLDRLGDPLYEAFVSTGLWPPTELNDVPRTIFDDDNSTNFYDQIAWFSEPDGTTLLQTLTYTGKAGHVDFLPHVLTGHTKNEVSWRISDHYPLWTEFRLTDCAVHAGLPGTPTSMRSRTSTSCTSSGHASSPKILLSSASPCGSQANANKSGTEP